VEDYAIGLNKKTTTYELDSKVSDRGLSCPIKMWAKVKILGARRSDPFCWYPAQFASSTILFGFADNECMFSNRIDSWDSSRLSTLKEYPSIPADPNQSHNAPPRKTSTIELFKCKHGAKLNVQRHACHGEDRAF
jgi:hypothetical protein